MTANKKRKIALTVDVEAHTRRAARDHVNRLIWGRQGGREAGIAAMMDIADQHGISMTFFLDYPEYELYGDELLDAGREIRRRGHDLEPHCHTEYLLKPLFGLDNRWAIRMPTATYDESRKIVDYWMQKHADITGQMPLAYRSGAYLIGPNYLRAMYDAGIRLDASYHALFEENPFPWGLRGNFMWENGLWEISIPAIPYFNGHNHLVPWNFNHFGLLRGTTAEKIDRHRAFLDMWFRRYGEDSIATLVMHSWSFWEADSRGRFSLPADNNIELFDALLTSLKKDYEFITISELAQNPPPLDDLEIVSFSENSVYCPVCYEPVSHFQDYNAPKRQCAFCKSVERQRTLVDMVYSGAFGPAIFNGKKVLHIAPGWPEKLLLRRMHDCDVTTLNIQPGCQMQADIQHMPELADASFDVVLASEVFRHVRNIDAALSEIRRILKPGGVLLASDCLEDADYGREITDHAEQISWYGEEKFAQYGIGDFRTFGRKDWPAAFGKYFHVRVFEAVDSGTGSPAWWLAAAPKQSGKEDDAFTPEMLAANAGRILHNAATDPIGAFLPEFDNWQNFRKNCPAIDCRALRNVSLNMNFFSVDAFPARMPDPDWPAVYANDYYAYNEQSWQHLLADIAEDSGDGMTRELEHLLKEALRWQDAYGFYRDSGKFHPYMLYQIWDDTSAASRLAILAYVFARILPISTIDDAHVDRIFRAIADHFLILCTDHFFVDRHNHGWIQMYPLLAVAMAMPFMNGAAAARRLTLARSLFLARKFTSAEGMYKEHTLSYHAFAIILLRRICDLAAGCADVAEIVAQISSHVEKMRTCTAFLLTPDGQIPAFGDVNANYPAIQEEIDLAMRGGLQPECTILPEAGYAVIRNGDARHQSYLAMAGAFHSLTHKHCDDLGFIWQEGQQKILVDSGLQAGTIGLQRSGALWDKGFFYAAANRVYVESAHAHNVVEINGETWSRRIEPWGALPLKAEKLDGSHWQITGYWKRPEGFTQKRRLILAPNRWLLVMDTLESQHSSSSKNAANFTQWFHFAADINCARDAGGGLQFALPGGRPLFARNSIAANNASLHKGEIYPRMQGWVATDSATLIPNWALGIHAHGHMAEFATLFALDMECKACMRAEDNICLEWGDGQKETVVLNKGVRDGR